MLNQFPCSQRQLKLLRFRRYCIDNNRLCSVHDEITAYQILYLVHFLLEFNSGLKNNQFYWLFELMYTIVEPINCSLVSISVKVDFFQSWLLSCLNVWATLIVDQVCQQLFASLTDLNLSAGFLSSDQMKSGLQFILFFFFFANNSDNLVLTNNTMHLRYITLKQKKIFLLLSNFLSKTLSLTVCLLWILQ